MLSVKARTAERLSIYEAVSADGPTEVTGASP